MDRIRSVRPAVAHVYSVLFNVVVVNKVVSLNAPFYPVIKSFTLINPDMTIIQLIVIR